MATTIQPLPIPLHHDLVVWCCRWWEYPRSTRPFIDALVNLYGVDRVQKAIIYIETREDYISADRGTTRPSVQETRGESGPG